jgi:hypothetical protein
VSCRFSRVSSLVAVLTLFVCLPASAQRPRPDRPYRGLFGGNGADPRSTQQLDVSLSFAQAYDDNIVAAAGQGTGDPRFQQDGSYGLGTMSLDYSKRAGRVTFEVSLGTGYRYYRSYEVLNGLTSFGSVGLAARLTPRTDVRLSTSGTYAPYLSFTRSASVRLPAAGDIITNVPDNPVTGDRSVSLSSLASINRIVTPRLSFTADYGQAFTDSRSGDMSYRNWSAGAGSSYRLGSRAAFTSSYHYHRGMSGLYQGLQSIDTQDVMLGVSYTKRLSPSRTMTFSVNAGPSIYRGYVPVPSDSERRQKMTRYPIVGGASLTRQIARTWSLAAAYSRGVQFAQGFDAPLFSNSMSVNTTGFLSQRSRMTVSVGYNTGSVGYSVAERDFNTATGAANYQFALTGATAIFVNYGFYHYTFASTVQLPTGLARSQDRHSVSIGVNLWAPLLR